MFAETAFNTRPPVAPAAWNEFHRRMAEWEAKRREGLKVHKP